MKKSWLAVSLINFLIAAIMGLLLRYCAVYPLAVTYTFLLHAHSHIALLGWVYMAIYSLLVHFLIPPETAKKSVYSMLFVLTQSTVIGMMVSFPLQGYALFSITFSTLHIILSYCFAYRLWKDYTGSVPVGIFLKASLIFMVLSTLGAWALGIIGSSPGKGQALYNAAIQFFLHFQFNGWFTGAVLAIFLHLLIQAGMKASPKGLRLLLLLWAGSVIATLALPLSWYYPSAMLRFANLIGLFLQLLSFMLLIKIVAPFCKTAAGRAALPSRWMLLLAVTSFGLRVFIQLFSVLPFFALAAHTIRNITIGFIHLLMLGGITGFIMVFIVRSGYINTGQALWKYGSSLFFIGFATTELLLFGQGLAMLFSMAGLPGYPHMLFFASTLLPLGLVGITASLLLSGNPNKSGQCDKYHVR